MFVHLYTYWSRANARKVIKPRKVFYTIRFRGMSPVPINPSDPCMVDYAYLYERITLSFAGPDTNGCQFFITTRPTPRLNGKHVLFGIVTDGQKFIHIIEQQLTDHLGRPMKEIRIKKCGLLDKRLPFHVTDHPRE